MNSPLFHSERPIKARNSLSVGQNFMNISLFGISDRRIFFRISLAASSRLISCEQSSKKDSTESICRVAVYDVNLNLFNLIEAEFQPWTSIIAHSHTIFIWEVMCSSICRIEGSEKVVRCIRNESLTRNVLKPFRIIAYFTLMAKISEVFERCVSEFDYRTVENSCVWNRTRISGREENLSELFFNFFRNDWSYNSQVCLFLQNHCIQHPCMFRILPTFESCIPCWLWVR